MHGNRMRADQPIDIKFLDDIINSPKGSPSSPRHHSAAPLACWASPRSRSCCSLCSAGRCSAHSCADRHVVVEVAEKTGRVRPPHSSEAQASVWRCRLWLQAGPRAPCPRRVDLWLRVGPVFAAGGTGRCCNERASRTDANQPATGLDLSSWCVRHRLTRPLVINGWLAARG
jgi:hypothetical protein